MMKSKYFLLIGLLPLIFLGFVVLIGFLFPEKFELRIHHMALLEKPVEEVWSAFDDPEHWGKWRPGLSSFEPITPHAGEVGARAKMTYEENGKTFQMIQTLTAKKRPEQWTQTLENKSAKIWEENRFETMNENMTLWTSTTRIRLKGFLRFMTPFLKKRVQEKISVEMILFQQHLKKVGTVKL